MGAGSKDLRSTIYTGNKNTLCTIGSRNRAPTSLDIMQPETGKRYPIGFFWSISANPSTGTEGDLYYLAKYVAGAAQWQYIDQNADPGTITGNDLISLTPVAGNWNIYGEYSSQFPAAHVMETNGSGNSLYVENRTSTTDFVVSTSTSVGRRGTFDTIQAAISEATSGQTIYLKAGTYTEDIELKNGVNLAAYGNSGLTPSVTIKGKLTFNGSGRVTISGIRLETNGDYSINVNGTSSSRLFLFGCFLSMTNFTHTNMSSTSSSTFVRFIDCWGETSTTAYGFFETTGDGSLTFWGTNFLDPSRTNVQSTFASSGVLIIRYSTIRFPITLSGTGRLSADHSEFNMYEANRKALTVSNNPGGNQNYLRHCTVLSGSAAAITIDTSLFIEESTILSTNAAQIDGAGTLTYTGLGFMYDDSNGISSSTTLTLARKPFEPGLLRGNFSGLAPSAGYLGQNVRNALAFASATTLSNNTAKNVTSITLTPGVWDVSGVVQFTAVVGGTSQSASVNNVSATMGEYGDNTVSSLWTATGVDDVGLTIPSYRILVPLAGGNITMYLVALATFSGGGSGSKAYGRISATRVA